MEAGAGSARARALRACPPPPTPPSSPPSRTHHADALVALHLARHLQELAARELHARPEQHAHALLVLRAGRGGALAGCRAGRWAGSGRRQRRCLALAGARTEAVSVSTLPSLLATAPIKITSLPIAFSRPAPFTRGCGSMVMFDMLRKGERAGKTRSTRRGVCAGEDGSTVTAPSGKSHSETTALPVYFSPPARDGA